MKKLFKRGLLFLFVSLGLIFATSAIFAADTGSISPNNYSNNNNVDNPERAYDGSANTFAEFDDRDDSVYYRFGNQFSIPNGSTITGIEVTIKGKTDGRDVDVTLYSGNNDRDTKTLNLNGTNQTYTLGSSSDDWYSGGSWTVNNINNNNNFRVRIDANSGGNSAWIDDIKVTVYYTAPATTPTVTTSSPATLISTTTATAGGNVTADGGATVTARGIQISLSNTFSSPIPFPAITGGTGAYTVDLSGLNPNTTYYYRAYATNSQGTSYATSYYSFKTRSIPTITDYSGTYNGSPHTITVGNLTTGDTVQYSLNGSTGWTSTPITVTNVTPGTTIYVRVTNSNYVTWTGSGTVTINKKSLTVSGIAANNKVYDGNTTATLNFGSASLNGVISGDSVSINTGSYTANFDNKNVGSNKDVTVSGLGLSGPQAGNYTLTQPTGLKANITAKALTVSGIVANNKVYDGNTTATLNFASASLNGVVSGDSVSINTGSYTANFDNKNVGNNKDVAVSGLGLSGPQAGNYTLTQPTGLKANITAKALTVSGIAANNKVYDGSTTATLNFASASLNGVVSGDSVSINTGSYTANFDNKNIGNNKDVAVSGLGLSGPQAGNYTLTQPTGLKANITAKVLTVSGIVANNKVYDGSTTATLNFGSASLVGKVTGDVVSLDDDSYVANFNNKNVGTDKPVTVSSIDLLGTDKGNYTLTMPAGLTADITAKSLTITGLAAEDKIYDGNTTATLNFGSASLVGIIGSEDVSLDVNNYTADFSDRNVGTDKNIIIFNIDLLGADKSNYSLTLPDDLKADITAKILTVIGAVAQNKIYDGTTNAIVNFSGASLDGVVGNLVPVSISILSLGDDVTLNTTGYIANFSDPEVGTDKDVSVTGLTLEGDDKDNYSLVLPLMLTADITPQEFTVTFNGTDIDVQIVLDGNKIVKPADPVKPGYTFGGWFKDAGLTTPWNFDTDTVTGDITLYPKWIKNASASVIPQTGQYALLIVSGILVATGFGFVALNKKFNSK